MRTPADLSKERLIQCLVELRRRIADLEKKNEETRKHEADLLQAKAMFEGLFEFAPDAIIIVDQHGRILHLNKQAETLFAYTREELIGSDHDILVPDVFRQVHQGHRENYMTAPGIRTMGAGIELSGRRKDGSEFPIDIVLGSMQLDGDLVALAVVRDFTEHRLAEQKKAELESQNRHLQKCESLGRMAGAIAHHFNNQLQVVMGYLSLATLDIPHGKDPTEKLTTALRAAQRAAEVSKMMLTYLGQTSGEQNRLYLVDACRMCLPLLRSALPKNVRMETGVPFPGPAIKANANQIQQIINNLVTNAWESISGNEGIVSLGVDTVSSADIPALHRYPVDWEPKNGEYACLEVRDSGSGIEEPDIEKLFDPFFTTKFTGRGLGLPVCLGLVRSHNGGITVESTAGKGSVFRAYFPALTEQSPDASTKIPDALKDSCKGVFLLVEDNELVLQSTKSLIENEFGFAVLTAADGVEALEVFQLHHKDICCVLCDLTMPRMDGWETIAALRELEPGIPVILTSGHEAHELMAGQHTEWPQALLPKPYSVGELSSAIKLALG